MVRLIFTIFLIVPLVSCLSQIRTGFLTIENHTEAKIEGKGRFVHQENYSDEFVIEPNQTFIYSQYEINAGTKSNILEQLAQLEIKKGGCVVVLDQKTIQQQAKFEGISVAVIIDNSLFTSCEK